MKGLKLVQDTNISFGLTWLRVAPNPNEEELFYTKTAFCNIYRFVHIYDGKYT